MYKIYIFLKEWGVDVPCLLEFVQCPRAAQFAASILPPLSGGDYTAVPLSSPHPQKALHICFGCEMYLHKILFSPANSTVHRHCVCILMYHHFPLRRTWSLSSHVMDLLSKGRPFRQFFSFIVHRLHQPFCCVWSPKFYFFKRWIENNFSVNIVLSLLTRPGPFFFFFSFLWQSFCLLVLSHNPSYLALRIFHTGTFRDQMLLCFLFPSIPFSGRCCFSEPETWHSLLG